MKLKLLILIILSPLFVLGQSNAKSKTTQKNSKLEQFSVHKFNQLIAQEPAVLVDFYAVWCGPCKKLAPILEKVATEKNIKLIKIDVDKNPALAQKLGIEGLPTVHFYRKGQLEWENLGFIPETELNSKL